MTELWYRFNLFAERQFFEKEFADGLIVPANLIAYYEIAVPELLRDCRLPFVVDPVTYICGIERPQFSNDGNFKKSVVKLLERLDCKIALNVLRGQQILGEKEGSPEFDEYIEKILQFQLPSENVKEPPRRKSMERIKRSFEEADKEEPTCIQPYALIPPYFLFNNAVGNPYLKTVYAARFAKDSEFGKRNNIFPCLCMEKNLLSDDEQMARIAEDFKDYKGLVLWINDFDETEATQSELRNFAGFIHKISERQTEIINFYGGYFSLMLGNAGLSKLSSGICYSQSRNAFVQAGGGGFPYRYYEPHLKIKFPNTNAFRLYSDIPELFTCSCPICAHYVEEANHAKDREDREKILSKFFGIPEKTTKGIVNWEGSRRHFLYSRKMEKADLGNKRREEIISETNSLFDQLKEKVDPNRYDIKPFEYLRFWSSSLEDI